MPVLLGYANLKVCLYSSLNILSIFSSEIKRVSNFFLNCSNRHMLQEVKLCRQLGCDGVVIGLLNTDGSIDVKERY